MSSKFNKIWHNMNCASIHAGG